MRYGFLVREGRSWACLTSPGTICSAFNREKRIMSPQFSGWSTFIKELFDWWKLPRCHVTSFKAVTSCSSFLFCFVFVRRYVWKYTLVHRVFFCVPSVLPSFILHTFVVGIRSFLGMVLSVLTFLQFFFPGFSVLWP